MGDKAVKLLAFIAGAIVGSVATYAITHTAIKSKLENEVRAEVEAIKDEYFDKARDLDKLKEQVQQVRDAVNQPTPEPETKPVPLIDFKDTEKYHDIVSKYHNPETTVHINNENGIEVTDRKEDDNVERPYIIDPYEFGELYDYARISLTHYADGILADDYDEVIEDVEGTVGSDYASHFGEYEADTVHIRNDFLQSDYEICRDHRNYSDVVN